MAEHIGGYRIDLENQTLLRSLVMHPSEQVAALCGDIPIPKSLNSRAKVRTKNQFSEGACCGFAQRAAMRLCAAIKGSEQDFSGDAQYYLTQQKDGIRGDQGSTISGGMWVCQNIGAVPDNAMPETASYDPGRLPSNVHAIASPYRIEKAAQLTTFRDVVEWLGRGYGGAYWGIRWGFRFDSAGNAIQWMPSGGGHATAILGYGGSTSSDGLPEWLDCLNSWGTSFGDGGWYRVTRAIFERVLRDSYTVVAGVSDMSSLKPRDIDWVRDSINA